MGNCVGRRNYRFFYAFILSLSFLTAFIFACVVTHLTLRELAVGVEASRGRDSELSQAEGLVTVPLSCVLSCFFLLRLSGKQLPFHSEGDTGEISFALCPLVDALVGTEAPSQGQIPTPHPVNRGMV